MNKLSVILGVIVAILLAVAVFFWSESSAAADKAGKDAAAASVAQKDADAAKAALEAAKAEASKSAEQVKKLSAQLAAAQKEAADAKSAGAASDAKIAELQGALDKANAAASNAVAKAKRAESTAAELERKLDAQRKVNEELNTQIAQLKDQAEYKKLATELETVKAELANTKKSLDEAKTAGAASAAELEKANEQIAKLQAEISALKNRTTRGVSFGSPDYRGF